MPEISLIDRSFSKDKSLDCNVSIQVNQDGLAYCVCDNTSGIHLVFKKFKFEHAHLTGDILEKTSIILNKDEILGLRFHSVKYLGYTRQSTLVPTEFFDKAHIRDYLIFNYGNEIEKEVYSNYIPVQDIYSVFALPRDLVSLITYHFKKVEFLSQTTPFLKYLTVMKDTFKDHIVYVGLNPDFFDIACMSDSHLRLYNTFQYTSENDLLYFILYVYRQLAFDPDKVPLLIAGEHSSKISYYEILKQYITQLKYADISKNVLLAPALQELNVVKFLNLLNIKACASLAEYTKEEK
jgi:hypothetical protein